MARFSDLPEEVLEDIMSWLPPESLMEFKLVQKSWYLQINALMNNPEFVAKHLRNMKKTMLSSLFYQFTSLSVVHMEDKLEHHVEEAQVEKQDKKAKKEDDHDFGGCFFVVTNDTTGDRSGSDYIHCDTDYLRKLTCCLDDYDFKLESRCDGIICFSAEIVGAIFLLNPARKEMKVIRCSCYGDDHELQVVGFGYDCRANEYKVVTITLVPMYEDVEDYSKADVYSLRTNSWREIKFDIEFPDGEIEQVYCDGVCYWYVSDLVFRIFSFDYRDEIFRYVPLPVGKNPPEDRDGLTGRSEISVWKESVVLFDYRVEAPMVMEMWVLDSQHGSYSWTKHLTIGPLEGIKCALGFWKDVKLILEAVDGEIKLYHLGSEVVSHFSKSLDRFYSDHSVSYLTSLVPLLRKEGRLVLQV